MDLKPPCHLFKDPDTYLPFWGMKLVDNHWSNGEFHVRSKVRGSRIVPQPCETKDCKEIDNSPFLIPTKCAHHNKISLPVVMAVFEDSLSTWGEIPPSYNNGVSTSVCLK